VLKVLRLWFDTRLILDLVRIGRVSVLGCGFKAGWGYAIGVGVPMGRYANLFCEAVIGVGVSGQSAGTSISV
jgi:hypothetical protein